MRRPEQFPSSLLEISYYGYSTSLRERTGSSLIEHLVSLSKGHQNKRYFKDKEREMLERIGKFGLEELKCFDVLLLSKIIQRTCNLDDESKDDSEKKIRSDIKSKIKKIEDFRHSFSHSGQKIINFTVNDYNKKITKFTQDADFLIRKSGELGGKTVDEIGLEIYEREIDITSLWESDPEKNPEDMETEICFTNSCVKVSQEKQKKIPDPSASHHFVNNKYEDKWQNESDEIALEFKARKNVLCEMELSQSDCGSSINAEETLEEMEAEICLTKNFSEVLQEKHKVHPSASNHSIDSKDDEDKSPQKIVKDLMGLL